MPGYLQGGDIGIDRLSVQGGILSRWPWQWGHDVKGCFVKWADQGWPTIGLVDEQKRVGILTTFFVDLDLKQH